jgi:hypothetical protein
MRNRPEPYVFPFRPKNWFLFSLAAIFLLSGCATKRYEGPTSGRSADSQLATSYALDKVLSSTASLSALADKRVYIEAFSLTEHRGEEGSPEELLLRAWFAEKLRQQKAQVVDRKEEADAVLSIVAKAMGVDVVRRDFPFIIYTESMRGRVDLHLVAFDPQGNILFTEDKREKVIFRDLYLFYLIGPFTSVH